MLELTQDDLDELDRRGEERIFPEGTVLIGEGEPVEYIYLIRAGRVRVEKKNNDAPEVIAHRGHEETFGVISLLDDARRQARRWSPTVKSPYWS